MPVLEYLLAMVTSSTRKVKKFDWSSAVPRTQVDKFDKNYSNILGLELTWRPGPGISMGLGRFDFWFGWPRGQESLHHNRCEHRSPSIDFPESDDS